jgi:hypothetical protein
MPNTPVPIILGLYGIRKAEAPCTGPSSIRRFCDEGIFSIHHIICL